MPGRTQASAAPSRMTAAQECFAVTNVFDSVKDVRQGCAIAQQSSAVQDSAGGCGPLPGHRKWQEDWVWSEKRGKGGREWEGVGAETTPHIVKVLVPPAGEDEVGPPLLRVWRNLGALGLGV